MINNNPTKTILTQSKNVHWSCIKTMAQASPFFLRGHLCQDQMTPWLTLINLFLIKTIAFFFNHRLLNFIKEIKVENVKNELLGLLTPLLCHMYLEMLRGGHGSAAQMFLKRHSVSLPQKDLSYHQPIDGNLPSALYRPNSLEQLFNSLQNGTIDNETPEKDFMNQLLDDIGSIYTLQEIETKPSIAAFR